MFFMKLVLFIIKYLINLELLVRFYRISEFNQLKKESFTCKARCLEFPEMCEVLAKTIFNKKIKKNLDSLH